MGKKGREIKSLRRKLRQISSDRIQRSRAADVLEGYYDPENYVDLREHLYDPTRRVGQSYGVNATTINDRLDGRNYPVFQSEQELAIIRGVARAVVDVNPMARGALGTLTNYVVHRGAKYVVTSSSKSTTDLVRKAQRVVNEFLDDNRWRADLDRELHHRLERDGEYFLGLWHVGDGRVQARVVEPDCVTAPSDPTRLEDWLGSESSSWSFGVHSDAGDVEERHGYYVQWSPNNTDWSYMPGGPAPIYPPEENGEDSWLVHAKVNTDRNVKRGLSSFFCNEKLLELARKLLRNVGEGASVQSAIAFFREHAAGITSGKLEAFLSGQASRSYTESRESGSKTSYIQKFDPGTIVDHGNGITYKLSALGNNNAPVFLEVVAALLRSAGAIWNMPEHMLTGTGDGSNYASILVVDSPFVKSCEAKQSYLAQCDQETLWKVLWFAWRAGRFGSIPWDRFVAEIELQISPPDVAVRDRDKETARRQVLWNAGLLSDGKWAAEEGLDYAQERTNGARPRGGPAGALPESGSSPEVPRATDETRNPLMKGEGAEPIQPVAAVSDGEVPAEAMASQDIQTAPELVLNDAQIKAALQIVLAVAGGTLPRDTGLGQLRILFNLTPEQSEQILGSAGTSTPTTANPRPANSVTESLSAAAAAKWEGYP